MYVCADYKLIVHGGPRGENHITECVRDYRLLNAGDYTFITPTIPPIPNTTSQHSLTRPPPCMQMSEWIKLRRKNKEKTESEKGEQNPKPPFESRSAGRKHKLCGESCERVSGFILHLSVFVFRNDAGCLRAAACQMGCK